MVLNLPIVSDSDSRALNEMSQEGGPTGQTRTDPTETSMAVEAEVDPVLGEESPSDKHRESLVRKGSDIGAAARPKRDEVSQHGEESGWPPDHEIR